MISLIAPIPLPIQWVNHLNRFFIGFLDDLFVDANFRGKRIGEKLLKKLKDIAGYKNWDFVRWISRRDNLSANTLYNRIAEKTTWDIYEIR